MVKTLQRVKDFSIQIGREQEFHINKIVKLNKKNKILSTLTFSTLTKHGAARVNKYFH